MEKYCRTVAVPSWLIVQQDTMRAGEDGSLDLGRETPELPAWFENWCL